MSTNVFTTTKVRATVRSAVAAIVGSLVAWATTKWANLSNGNLAYLVPVFSTAYFAAIHFLEKKYPKFGWLLGLLPQAKTTPVVPTPAPAPAPAPAPEPTPEPTPAPVKSVKKAPAKKAAPKTTEK